MTRKRSNSLICPAKKAQSLNKILTQFKKMYRGFNFCVPATYNDMDCIEMKAQCVRLSGRAFVFGLLFAGLGLLVPVGSSKLYAQSVSKSIRVTKTDDGRKMVYGKATHYSRSLEGTKTAIGTRYHNDKYTAASNFFKLRTWVKVTRLSNGRSVTVFINDRMHPNMASKGRVIDLSIAAAQSIHFLSGAGITRVKVEEVPKPEITEPLKSNQSAPESEISEYDR